MSKNKGNLKIARDVVLNIIGLAALDVEGVAKVEGFNSMIGEDGYIINENKGIQMETIDAKLYVNLSVVVYQGVEIPKVSRNIQNNIIKEVLTMTNLHVEEVNIEVIDVY